jgi:hypothetical protein
VQRGYLAEERRQRGGSIDRGKEGEKEKEKDDGEGPVLPNINTKTLAAATSQKTLSYASPARPLKNQVR